ncbi:unnamed protein product [Toxocara canis]|uniref:EF-hand domain-containing protein n=1 Tax=Toxocara canis TaxID=6265 RepID=A0A183ULP5_TOXCA|nr:unnamed protein product [Toxocara canis]
MSELTSDCKNVCIEIFNPASFAGRGFLERSDFLQIPELEINPLGDRIIDAFFAETQPPQTRITFTDFARVLAHFRPCSSHEDVTINSRSEKLRFAFAMYDLNKNGYITRQEFKIILNMMIGSNITPEQLESITDRTITEGDYEKNGKISFKEFCRVSFFITYFKIKYRRFHAAKFNMTISLCIFDVTKKTN